MIIAVLNQKGGAGKSTLSVHIAAALTLRKRKVLLVDADQQSSSLLWSASREGEGLFPVIGLATKNLHKEIRAHVGHYDDIVIDGPPRVGDVAGSAVLAADFVLIPVQPSPYDVWAAKEIVDLVIGAPAYNENQKSAFVINRRIAKTAIGAAVVKALAGYDIPVLTSTIGQRVAFAESAANGSTVFEMNPTSAASNEINAVLDELLEMMGDR